MAKPVPVTTQDLRQAVGAWYANERENLKARASKMRLLVERIDRGEMSDLTPHLTELNAMMTRCRVSE